MVAPHSQHVALTRVDIRAPAPRRSASHRLAAPLGEAERRPPGAHVRGLPLTFRKHARWGAGIAAATAIGAIAATAPWAATTTPSTTTAEAHATTTRATATQDASQSGPQAIYDSVSPASIPPGQHVATYADGPFQATSASVADRGNVLWIDTNATDTHADALDVEPGDATPAQAATWTSAKLTANPASTAIVYTFKADWSQVQASINALPTWMHSHVKYWIADPTGTPHMVPGASATQWYWGTSYDISMAQPGFFS